MAEVRLENITKIYPGNEEYTVKETSLTINDKEFVVLVGDSNCFGHHQCDILFTSGGGHHAQWRGSIVVGQCGGLVVQNPIELGIL